ncbi:MAG: type II restriction endonuclease [Reichenbachiella sp.]|uniref:type II restriction endonuclease n=1 Tax=Reichenbachiella sp. TaxID=2184521 RepID=UPI0032632E2D
MSLLEKAVRSAQNTDYAFTKFITANDAGKTGGHQAGFHIHKHVWPLFFDTPGDKGENKDKFVTIKWQDDFETDSRFIYYGVGTRNEYRLTRFGKGFPFLTDDNVGDLLVLCKVDEENYEGYVLSTDEEIEDFFAALNISSSDTNQLIPKQFQLNFEEMLTSCFRAYIESLSEDFPPTIDLACNARNCYNSSNSINSTKVKSDPDKIILGWLDAEYDLFKTIENDRYSDLIKNPFGSVEDLVNVANTILNRRKSRAGRSLEHHLEEVFNTFQLAFESQVVTENNKKPDFLFPGIENYHDPSFDEKKLILLASKTTCKDRWRQVLNEADRIRTKHLFTLQQGVSSNQLKEMKKYGVQLVVPKAYLNSFPKQHRNEIMTLDSFISYAASIQNS